MKQLFLAAGVFCVLSSFGMSAQNERNRDVVYTESRNASNRSSDPVINEIIRLEQRGLRNIRQRDRDGLNEDTSNNFRYLSPQGEFITKSRWLDRVVSGDYGIDLLRNTPYLEEDRIETLRRGLDYHLRYQIQKYGDTAVVMGIQTLTVPLASNTTGMVPFYFTRVYARDSGRWRLVHLHLTRRDPRDPDPFAPRSGSETD